MEVIQTLLSQGSFVNFQDRHGNTPLHVACKDGNVPIVVALCEASCDLDISNKVRRRERPLEGLLTCFRVLFRFSLPLFIVQSVFLLWTFSFSFFFVSFFWLIFT